MGLFDFWKGSPKPAPIPEPAATLEELLAQAARDPAFRPEFYRRLLLEPLVVITAGDPATAPLQQGEAEDAQPLRIVVWEDGRVPVFTSPDRIFDKKVVTAPVAYAQLKGRGMLEMLRGKTLVLNPYADFGKELLPAEIDRILSGTLLDTGTRVTVQRETRVLLGQPANYPTELVQALRHLLSQQPRVRAAYLGWIHDPGAPEPPHYIICLDVEGEMRAISKEAGYVAQQVLGPGQLLDIVQADHSSLTDYFRSTKPFYER